ncbi:MAG TPA: CusA/CzcA family heavy metal efflux RND transporter [Phycisphaerae bacterium]|nr:CusA/CzcA family heavy metal efflux RND transporter [Phycisphaerae bacterium]HRY67414.1 CusA/CzcA family heavy metal efflux RND transporter [Phycisphaerae bacterium]HSA28995.1 CusA/CzcA family heavy metal efflux RND transporter [Phycisphaerae bacterium]
MMTRIIQFAIHQRLLMVLLAIGLAALGAWNFTRLPIDAVPDVTNKQVQINTAVTGLSPVEIEKQITCPIEWAMQGIPGVEQIRSVSFYGVSQVTVIFDDHVDLYRARQLVNERLAEAKENLPPGVGAPFMGPIWTGLGEIYFWSVDAVGPKPDGAPYTPMDLKTIQEWIVKPQLRSIPGITEINTIGGYEKQFHVSPDPMKLISYGLSFRDVLEALATNNANAGGGYIEHSGEQYTIRSTGQIRALPDIGSIKLGTHDGVPFFVKDVAEVSLGTELRTGAGTANGHEAVVGTAILLYGANSRTVAHSVDEKIAQVSKVLPENVRINTLYNRTYLVDATLETVRRNLTEGAILVVVILFLLLGNVRAAIIVALAIPLSMLFAITGMVQGRISANLMSLGAIDFGIIVDGAVVMIENIVRRVSRRQRELGRVLTEGERFQVVEEAAVEVGRPTLFGVGIIMIVYLPILSLSGVEGKMFKPMAEVVLLALAGALLLTFTIVPALAALVLRGRMAEREFCLARWAKAIYAPVIDLVLHLRWAVVLGAVAVLAVTGVLGLRMGSEFVPRLSEGALALQPTRMPSIALSSSVMMQEKVEQLLMREFPDEIASVFARTGTSEVVTDVCGPEVSDTYIMLKPREQWKKAKTQVELAEAMDEAVKRLPGQNYEFSQPIELRMNELISGVRSDLAVKVYGDEMEIMLEYANMIAQELRNVRGAEDVKVEQVAGMPMVNIDIDREAVARYGLNVKDVQEVIEIAMGGGEAGQVIEGDRRFPLVVRLPESLRGNIRTIGVLPIPLPKVDEASKTLVSDASGDGDPRAGYIPLSSVAKIGITEGARQIRREDGKRRIVVQCNVRGRDLGTFVAEAQQRIEQKVGRLPEGYWLGWGGQFENLIAAKKRLTIVVPLALGLILILLFATFNSIKHAIVVFTGVPLALTGGVVALWLRGIPLSISAGVGFIALSGVAVLNGLVMVTFINQLRREGKTVREAIIEGSLTRLRPVLMTAMVASFGFLPMAVATGTGAEVQRPLATVVIGGIISSTLLTLVVLPAVYGWARRREPSSGGTRRP